MNERRIGRKRITAILAIVTGAILLIGGSTYALWSASDHVEGGTIITGDFNLKGLSAIHFDVSSDRADSTDVEVDGNALTFGTGQAVLDSASDPQAKVRIDDNKMQGHAVVLGDWRIVPGDTVAAVLQYEVTLVGDNLVADLTIDNSAMVAAATADDSNEGVSFYYAVFGMDGVQIGTTQPVGTTVNKTLQIVRIQANNDGQSGTNDTVGGNLIPIVDANNESDGTATVTLVVFGYFDYTTPDRDFVEAENALGSVTATLTQVREDTDQFDR